jgi:hypothetical protein
MREHFELQLKESGKLTDDSINRMKQARIDKLPRHLMDDDNYITPKSSFGTVFQKGDIVLYFLEEEQMGSDVNVSMKTILLRELNTISDYQFISMDNKIPRVKKV